MGKKADAVQQEIDRFKDLVVDEVRQISAGGRGVHWSADHRDEALRNLGLLERYQANALGRAGRVPQVGDILERGSTWLVTSVSPSCHQTSPRDLVCTRPPGHPITPESPHVAYSSRVLEVWN